MREAEMLAELRLELREFIPEQIPARLQHPGEDVTQCLGMQAVKRTRLHLWNQRIGRGEIRHRHADGCDSSR